MMKSRHACMKHFKKTKEGRENDSLRAVVLNLVYTFSNHLREFLSPDFKGEPLYQFEEWNRTQTSVSISIALWKYNWRVINYTYLKCAVECLTCLYSLNPSPQSK